MSECGYLGHVIRSGTVCPESAKIEAVRNFEQPTTKTKVRSFLGVTGYNRKFIPDYATLTVPLTDLTRKTKHNQVVWTPECAAAFHQLKDSLCSSLVLKSPDWDKPFILQTDASNRVGAVLSQPTVVIGRWPTSAESCSKEKRGTRLSRRSVWPSSWAFRHSRSTSSVEHSRSKQTTDRSHG